MARCGALPETREPMGGCATPASANLMGDCAADLRHGNALGRAEWPMRAGGRGVGRLLRLGAANGTGAGSKKPQLAPKPPGFCNFLDSARPGVLVWRTKVGAVYIDPREPEASFNDAGPRAVFAASGLMPFRVCAALLTPIAARGEVLHNVESRAEAPRCRHFSRPSDQRPMPGKFGNTAQ